MKHRHHIQPRHAGGTDATHNIQILTVAEHAEAHRVLFEQHGRWEDKIAWLGLSGTLSKEEIIAEVLSQAGHRGKYTLDEWHAFMRGKTYEEIFGVEKAEKLRRSRSERFTGKKNPMYGKARGKNQRLHQSQQITGRIEVTNGVRNKRVRPS